MQYELILTGKFKKSLKLAKRRGLNLELLDEVVTMLQKNIPLEEKYLKENDVLTLTLVDTGSHADLFNM